MEGIQTLRPTPHPGPRCVTHHRQAVKARKASRHEAHVQATYGLEPGEYKKLYDFQDGCCYICRRARGISKNLAVDHDHISGLPRGLCCTTCNRVLLGQYDRAALLRAVDYLDDPPYNRMRRSK